MHSTYFVYGYMASDIVKDYSDNEKGNSLSQVCVLLFPISSKIAFV